MSTIHIDPLDDESKKALLKAVADRGYANGLKAASIMLEKLVDQRMRVVGTNTIRDIATALREKTAERSGYPPRDVRVQLPSPAPSKASGSPFTLLIEGWMSFVKVNQIEPGTLPDSQSTTAVL